MLMWLAINLYFSFSLHCKYMRPSLQTKDQTIPSYMKLNKSFESSASICLLDPSQEIFFVLASSIKYAKKPIFRLLPHPYVLTIWTTPYLFLIALMNSCLNWKCFWNCIRNVFWIFILFYKVYAIKIISI
jgi:hypothetical protein